MAAALGVAPLADEPALDGLVRLIDDKHMLLVLDNFEHVLAAAHVVGELMEACEGLRILITSREPLRLSVSSCSSWARSRCRRHEQGLDPVSIQRSPAIRLFVERCRARDPGFVLDEANAAGCRDMRASRRYAPGHRTRRGARDAARSRGDRSRRLDDAFTVLVGGPRDAPPRQQTLRATLDWSHALLDEEQQTAFAGLAVFSGGCTLEAAEAVLGIDLGAVEALLAKSLLVTHTQDGGVPRVRMLEPVRRTRSSVSMERRDAEDLRRRHCEYYVAPGGTL